METKEVETSIGTFTLKKPKAGARNRSLAKAETATGIKKTVFFTDLLPHCVLKRPEGCDADVPIEHILNDLEMEDYDALVVVLSEWTMDKDTQDSVDKKKES